MPSRPPERSNKDLISDEDLYLFSEGRHLCIYEKLGAQPILDEQGREAGCHFAVWAPNAHSVSVMGDWNGWQPDVFFLQPRGVAGIFSGTVDAAKIGQRYVYRVNTRDGQRFDKADPVAAFAEVPPARASIIWRSQYEFHDAQWLAERKHRNALHAPISIYELHLGSWRRVPEEGNRHLSYRELAPLLCDYVSKLGFTHVELLPLMEHPFYGSWGYQVTGFFAPTSRYGTPDDLKFLIDSLHQRGIGVILDWVPSHFPSDGHGLSYFDGTHLYEHADPRKGVHPEWNSLLFNYGRNEVRSFLLSSALAWLDRFHVDGLRVDGVASMLYLDYARKPGEWIPNPQGGRENLEAVRFLRELTSDIQARFPDALVIAEESTSWPQVTGDVKDGGLGFSLKWDMGWMHDTLTYLERDPVHRRFHHRELTFRMMYAYAERFVLALSHDEVVHLKGSLLAKMAGDDWQQRANLRLLFGYQYATPGKKLIFMGGELGQRSEWNHDSSLEWHRLESHEHQGLSRFVGDLNAIYAREPALSCRDFERAGFEWLVPDDAEHGVIAFVRHGERPEDSLLVACNFTPVPRPQYQLGTPRVGTYVELLNSDAEIYGGSGQGNLGRVEAEETPHQGKPCSVRVLLPPLAIVIFKAQ